MSGLDLAVGQTCISVQRKILNYETLTKAQLTEPCSPLTGNNKGVLRPMAIITQEHVIITSTWATCEFVGRGV